VRGTHPTLALPKSMTESFSYGPTTALETHTDFNGQTTSFSYDSNGRLQEKFYADGTQESKRSMGKI